MRSQLKVNSAVVERKYNIQIVGRGEEMLYLDGSLKLWLERTYYNGHRLYCSSAASDSAGIELAFVKRKNIIQNLCDYFDTKQEASIFVLDEADKDREELELLFSDLVSNGHKIIVEYDSAKKRELVQDEIYIGFLDAGKTISIGDEKIESVNDYWRWKEDTK